MPFEVRARLALRREKRSVALDDRRRDEDGDPSGRFG
jgi:hypothetical protein